MSFDAISQPNLPGPRDGQAGAPAHTVRQARTSRMIGIGVGLLTLFLILLIAGVASRVLRARELASAADAVRTRVPSVYIVRPQRATKAELSLAATTQAMQDAIIYARTSGYIARRFVDIGDRVKAGQLLLQIASPEVDQELEQARAMLRQSQKTLDLQKASLDLAQVTMGRYQAADAEKAVAIEAVDQAVSTFRSAEAAVDAAEATVESNKANVQRLLQLTSFERVLAPFSGTVIQRNIDVGTLVTAGSPTDNTAVAPSTVNGTPNGLFEVANVDTLRVFVSVPQAYAPEIHVGLPVQIVVRGHLDQPIASTVTRSANAIDPGTRTLLTEIDIRNQTHQLHPGMFVYANFNIAPAGTRWRLPSTAGIFDAKGTRVAIVQDNKIHFQHVDIGRDLGESIDVQGGLRGNEAVVAQPTVSLKEGDVVTPIEVQPERP